VGNTLWKAVRQRVITAADASQKFSYFLTFGIGSIELSEADHREVLKWSLDNEATCYDSTYVKASGKVRATLLTADDILYDKACRETSTLHLKEYRRQ